MIRPRRWGYAALVAGVIWTQSGEAQMLLQNGSFEQGEGVPSGWKALEGGTWATGDAHRGKRHLRGETKKGRVVWESDPVSLQPETDYRVEGWVRCPSGEGRLGVDLLDARGQVIGQAEVPAVRDAAAWTYTAAEWGSGRATSARIRFWGKGRADLDDAGMAPTAMVIIGNPGLEGADAKGRIPYWSEEKDSLLVGARAGASSPDTTVTHEGKASLKITATGDWFGVGSVNFPVGFSQGWADRVRLSAWVRTGPKGSAQLLACWTNDEQKVVHVDSTAQVRGQDWQRISIAREALPEGASTLRLVAVAHGGEVWFDGFEPLALRPQKRQVRIFVNQVGYEALGPKSAVVATNFFPTKGTGIDFQMVTPEGKVVLQRQVSSSGRIHSGAPDDWGWYFWRADFSGFREEGGYRAAASAEGVRGESFPFRVGQGVLFRETAGLGVDFFFVQRCGFEVPGWHKACHMDAAKLPDSTHIDVTGGWHSAGDYNKPQWQFGDSAVPYALAAAFRAAPEVLSKPDRDGDGLPDALDEARWGLQFLAKMQRDSGALRNDVNQGPGRTWMKFSPPEDHSDNIIGTADDPVFRTEDVPNTPLAAASWASAGRLLEERGVKGDYIARAERFWDYTVSHRGEGDPMLLMSTLELGKATRKERYRESARRSAELLLKGQQPDGRFSGDWVNGDLAAAGLGLFALAYPDDPLRGQVVTALKGYAAFSAADADNPFGLTRQGDEETNRVFFHKAVGMGVNFWILGRGWANLLIHRLTGDPAALAYAVDQIDWVFGKNPLDLCMFEGKGSLNPPRYHHRYATIPGRERGAVPGAIPNGFLVEMGLWDRAGFDMRRGPGRASFRSSEPWLVHNIVHLLAISALHETLNGGK
ncbi:MAG: hypothetical protein EXS64_03535 [Candidatus Latescibacteria bacterium]|nr:hypothetical protein [Candidatus Latescibacterota bacterium]